MRRNLTLFLALALAAALPGCGEKKPQESAAGGIYTPGVYEGKGQGYGGEVTVSLTVDAETITDVKITGDKETPTVGGAAMEELAGQIKEKGTDIDGVAGATVTSDGVREAAEAAIAQARGEKGAASS